MKYINISIAILCFGSLVMCVYNEDRIFKEEKARDQALNDRLIKQLGKTVVISGDTLVIVNYGYASNTLILSNGDMIRVEAVEKMNP